MGVPEHDILPALAYAVQCGHLVEHDDEGGVSYSTPNTAILAYDRTSGNRAEIDPSSKWVEEEAPIKHGIRWRNIETDKIRYDQPSAGRFAEVGGEEHTADRLNRAQSQGLGVKPGKGIATGGVESRIMMLATEGGKSLQGEGVLAEIINADKRLLKGQVVALAQRLGLPVNKNTSKTAALAHIENALRQKAGGVPKPGDSPKEAPGKQESNVLSSPAGGDGAGGKGPAESPDSQLSPVGDNPKTALAGEAPGPMADNPGPASVEEPVAPGEGDGAGRGETPGATELNPEERRPDESLKEYMKRQGDGKHYKDVSAYARSMHKQAKSQVDERNAVYDRLAELITDKTGKRFSRRSPLLKDGGDHTQVPGFDEAVDTIADEFPGVFRTERGELRGSLDTDEKTANAQKAWEIVKDGMQDYPETKEFEQRAYEEAKANNFDTGETESAAEYNKPEAVDLSFDFGANVEGNSDAVDEAGTGSTTEEPAETEATDNTATGAAETSPGSSGAMVRDEDAAHGVQPGATTESPGSNGDTTGADEALVSHPLHVDEKSIFAQGNKRGGFSAPSIGMHAFKGANAIWHHQGDPQQTLFNASQKGASEWTGKTAEQIKAAHEAGYRLKNFRAGKYGTMWVYHKDGKILTQRGAQALVEGKGQHTPAGPGRENAKPTIDAVHKFIQSLPDSTKGDLGALVSAINRSPLGEHVKLSRDDTGMLRLSDKAGTWHVFEPSAGKDSSGNWQRQLDSSLPRFLHKIEHMAGNEIGSEDGAWAQHDRAADAYAVDKASQVDERQDQAPETPETPAGGQDAAAVSRPVESGQADFMRQEEAGPHQADDIPGMAGQSFTNDQGLTVDLRKAQDGTWSVGTQTGLTQAGAANALNKMKAEKAQGLFGAEVTAQGDNSVEIEKIKGEIEKIRDKMYQRSKNAGRSKAGALNRDIQQWQTVLDGKRKKLKELQEQQSKSKEQLQWAEPAKRKDDGAALPGMRDTFAPGMFGAAANRAEEVSPTGDSQSLVDLHRRKDGMYRAHHDAIAKPVLAAIDKGGWHKPEDLYGKVKMSKKEAKGAVNTVLGDMKEHLQTMWDEQGNPHYAKKGEKPGKGLLDDKAMEAKEKGMEYAKSKRAMAIAELARPEVHLKGNANGDVSADTGSPGQGEREQLLQQELGQQPNGASGESHADEGEADRGGQGEIPAKEGSGPDQAQGGEEKSTRPDAGAQAEGYGLETAHRHLADMWKESHTPEQHRANFKQFTENKEAVLKGLQGKTIKELKSDYGVWRATNKAEAVEEAYSRLQGSYNYSGVVSYNPFEEGSYAKALQEKMEKLTPEEIKAKQEERRESQAERQARLSGMVKALKNPETDEEIKMHVEQFKKGKEKEITPEIQKKYDSIKAKETLAKHAETFKQNYEQRQSVKPVEGGKAGAATFHETKHTRTGEPLFVVQLGNRVERDEYTQHNQNAKRLGGYYSSYRGNGAIPGFTFKDKGQAEKFHALLGGQEVKRDEKTAEEVSQEKKDARTSALREKASSIKAQGNEKIHYDGKENTYRRSNMAESRRAEGRRLVARAETMERIADAIEANEAPALEYIRDHSQVAALHKLLSKAKYERRNKTPEDQREKWEDFQAKDYDEEDVKHASLYDRDLAGGEAIDMREHMGNLAKQMAGVSGFKRLAERFKHGGTLIPKRDVDDVLSMAREAQKRGNRWPAEQIIDRLSDIQRLARAGITNDSTLREALRQYLPLTAKAQAADPIHKAIQAVRFKKKEGFFPTPKPLTDSMLQRADIKPGMKVLEPSAGIGSIMDHLHEEYGDEVESHGYEVDNELADITRMKGHDVETGNFMDVEPKAEYDRVLMNPPFEKGQDIEHVQRAFEHLKPGGKLVAIMSEGPFFRQDKKAQAFREWLESNAGKSEKMEPGSFKGAEALRETGTNTRMVTITKR